MVLAQRSPHPPDKRCINVWSDAAIGFSGMDFEVAMREEQILILIFG